MDYGSSESGKGAKMVGAGKPKSGNGGLGAEVKGSDVPAEGEAKAIMAGNVGGGVNVVCPQKAKC